MTTGDSCAGDEEDWPIAAAAAAAAEGRLPAAGGRNLGVTGGDKGAIMGAKLGAKWSWPATPAGAMKVEKDQDQARRRRRRTGHSAASKHKQLEGPARRNIEPDEEQLGSMSGEPSEQREHRRRRKRKRAESRRRVVVVSSLRAKLSMRPGRRQLLALGLLAVLATSLLAYIGSPAHPCGPLIGQCHALAAGEPANGTSPRPKPAPTTPAGTASLERPATGGPPAPPPSTAPAAHQLARDGEAREPEPAALTAGEKANASQQRSPRVHQLQRSTSYRQSLATAAAAAANEVQAAPSSPPAVIYTDRHHQAGAGSQPPPPAAYSQRQAELQTVQVRSGGGRLEGEIVVGRPVQGQQAGQHSTAAPSGLVPMMAPTTGRASGAIRVIAAPSLAVTSIHAAPTNPPAASTRHHHQSAAPQTVPAAGTSPGGNISFSKNHQASSTRAPPNLHEELSSNQLDHSLAQFMDGPGFGFGPPPPPPPPPLRLAYRPPVATASVGLNHHHGLGHHTYTALPLAEHLLNEHLFPAASLARPLLLRAATQELPALLAAAAEHHAQHHAVPAGYKLVPAGQVQVKQSTAPRGLVARFTSKSGHQKGNRRPLVQMGSQSAPSISLPPLTHFLVPRNPFRLFSSSSAHARYRPPPSKANEQAKSHQDKNKHGPWSQQLLMASSQPSKAFQGTAKLLAMDGLDIGAGPLTYAHSHSAEQLERLVRAASQASGLHSPILPAIVQAPTGKTYPGLYIPAIESESESQVSELRPGESAQMAALASSSIISKIPGTDYILHPDEVRAMINIGESAWRQQQQQQQASGSEAHEVSSSFSNQHQQNQFLVPLQQQPSQVSGWAPPLRGQQLMLEDHAQNLRDFAFVEPKFPHKDQSPAQSSIVREQFGSYNNQSAPANHSNTSTSHQQLSNHFQAQQVHAFPAVIRLNDQDYVHLPMLRMAPSVGQQPQYQLPVQGQRLFTLLAGQPTQSYLAPPPQPVPYNQQRLVAPGSQPAASQPVGSQVNQQLHQPDNSPLRLATQLTPNEINQVEESILEALLIAQQLDRQRKATQTMATAASNTNQQQQAIYLRPINLRLSSRLKSGGKASLGDQVEAAAAAVEDTSPRPKFRMSSLFGHRRRRRRNSQQQQQQKQQGSPVAPDWMQFELAPPILLHHPDARQEAGELESKLSSQRAPSYLPLPALLADQDTNKPFRGGANHHRSTAASELAESQSESKPVVVPDSGRRSNAPDCREARVGSFGSRVRHSAHQNCATRDEQQQQQQLSASPSSQSSRHTSAGLARHRPRVFVDWSGEESDADYFPPAAHRGHHSRRPSAAPSVSVSAESRHKALAGGLEPAKKFVPSQLKLQFAQDYQAREGVPIYNNNVRAAGALDRHRQALVHHLGSRPKDQHEHQESRTAHEREGDEDQDDDQDDDLEQRAASTQDSRARPNVTSKRAAVVEERATGTAGRPPTTISSTTRAPVETSSIATTAPPKA